MKGNFPRRMFSVLVFVLVAAMFSSCERVAPNYYGVKMSNYGKDGKSDYSVEVGKVWTAAPGVELWQVPAWEQRADFGNRTLHLKSSDNTEFFSKPIYSYKVIKQDVIDVVFNNARLGSGEDFMRILEDNILEAKIYDIVKEESRKFTTEELMSTGGSLKFEKHTEGIVKEAFAKQGLELIVYNVNLDFSDGVKKKLDNRNESNTNVSVIDQQIIEQRKRNELQELKAQEMLIRSRGLTPEILQEKFIEAWRVTKAPIYTTTPLVKNLK